MTTFDQELTKQLSSIKNEAHHLSEVQSSVALGGLHMQQDTVPGNGDGIPTTVDKAKAIADLFDLQEKCSINFMILGDLARTIRSQENIYDGKKIECGFPVRQLTAEVKSLFTTWKFTEEKYGYSYFYTPPIKWDIKIPVEIHVWKRKYEFFDNPDFGFFGVEKFNIPNPFEKYWKVRNLIQ